MTRSAARSRHEHNVVNGAIHRVIEYHVASRPDAIAVTDGPSAVTYRELNQRANALARRLSESGLTRGAIALVRMERSINLATVLLAVLKAGAAYAWIDPASPDDVDLPADFCIQQRSASAKEEAFLAVDLRGALAACADRPSPNLPIVTRGSDVACALLDGAGHPKVLVPHATITALPADAPSSGEWSAAAGAFDLWLGLMGGATVTVPTTAAAASAAA
jgi:nonribosomal peptide synthetase DhbF